MAAAPYLTLVVAYLIGAIPFGLLIGKLWKGVDIREHGSGNLGATNALRVLGKRVGALVLLLDLLKGLLPVLLFPVLLTSLAGDTPGWLPAFVAVAAVLGHVFPIYLRFRGGKGVATSAGAFGALHPLALLSALVVFLLALAVTRWVSLGSILAALTLPLAALLLEGPELALGDELPRTSVLCLAALLVVARHRTNLRRLLEGTEPRLGATPLPLPADPPSS